MKQDTVNKDTVIVDDQGNRYVESNGHKRLLVPADGRAELVVIKQPRIAKHRALVHPEPGQAPFKPEQVNTGENSSADYSKDWVNEGWWYWPGISSKGKPNRIEWNFIQRKITIHIAGFDNRTSNYSELPWIAATCFYENGNADPNIGGFGIRWVEPPDSDNISGGETAEYTLDGSIHRVVFGTQWVTTYG